MADQRDPWEVYSAPPPSSIAGPPKAFEPGEQERLGLARSADTRDAQRLGLAQENDTQQQDNTRFSRASTLRGDYDQLPTVKSYTTALPKYAAGLASKPDAAGDLNLIYAYASVMDPNSVVRGEEQEAVAGGDTFLNQTTAALKKQLGQGGTFQPEYRKRLREEMANRMGQLNQSFISERVRFKQQADREGINPLDVVGEHPGGRFQDLTRKVLGREPMQLDYNGDPVPHPTSDEPGTPAVPQMEGDIGFNVAAKDKATHTPQQEQALASFFAAAPNATPEQIEGFAKSIGLPGVSNAKELSEYYRKGGRGFGGVNELTPEAVKKAAKATIGDTSNGTAAGIVDAVPFAPQIGAAIDTLGLTPGRPSIANSDQSIGDVYAFNRDANNEALTMAQDQAPVSYALGQAGTMIAGGAGIARALPAAGALGAWASRGSLPAQIAKSAPIEAAYGALYGAGRNPNDPLKGALQNGIAAAGGGALGRGAVGSVGALVAPSAGKLGALFKQGVRPTPGQKYANRGFLGAALNGAEEAFQSFPGLGYAVRGAREGAREDFERGAFNKALGEINDQLPSDLELGTAPHAYMQNAFSKGYETTLPKLTAVADDQFAKASTAIRDDVASGGLSDESATRFNKIIDAEVTRRFEKTRPKVSVETAQQAAANPNLPNASALWNADRDTLETALKEASASDDQKIVMALGADGAAEYKKLDRARNNMYDTKRADEASRQFDAKFGDDKLTADQQRLIYGIGETDAQADDIREVLNAHNDLAMAGDGSRDWLGYIASLGARKVSAEDLAAVTQGRGSASAQAAFIRMQGAYQKLSEQGVAAGQIPGVMAEALVNQAGWRADQASEVIGSFVQDFAKAGRAARPLTAPGAAPVAGEPLRLSGEDLKDAVSMIGKRIRGIRSSASGDRDLASALEDYVDELKASAGRHSDPQDVERLAQLDRGYAMGVRIEDAAKSRAGDPGRFSPTQFDRAVQVNGGGIRSKAYLRGDALMQDYAEAGKTLVDKLPNSGTPERLLATQGALSAPLAALGYTSPVGALGAALVTAPYLPGVRRATKGLLTPRKSVKLNTLGDIIRRNAALGSAAGAPLLLPGEASNAP